MSDQYQSFVGCLLKVML